MLSATPPVPLILRDLVFRGVAHRPDAEIVTRQGTVLHRQTLAQTVQRAHGLAHGLSDLGVQVGDRVATLMWNDHRHLEAYLAVPCMGAVLHALNLRLPEDELAWVLQDAGDSVILADAENAQLAMSLAKQCGCQVVVADGAGGGLDWDTLANPAGDYPWPDLDENAAMGICHTSGTTGRPRGVVYSHRSTWLHTILICMTDFLGLSQRDRLLGIIPMFHALGWGFPYAACMLGADQVLPGVRPRSADLLDMVESERVTCAGGVPTVWNMLMEAIQAEPDRWDLSSLERVMCGGGSGSREMRHWYQETLGLPMQRSWGMTELNPIGTYSNADNDDDSGIPLPGLHLRLEGDEGESVENDGESVGSLQARGPTVAGSYLHDMASDHFKDGWLITGDLATISSRGAVTIQDRAKDIIKSGGEWISSLALELCINDVPGVRQSAVVGRPHPKWEERPVAMVVLEEGQSLEASEILSAMDGFEKWQRPDDFLFVEALPMTGTGKIDKNAIRVMLDEQHYVLPALRGTA